MLTTAIAGRHGVGVVTRAFTVPTQSPESDGTLDWSSTTLVLVEITADGTVGVGLTYADVTTAAFIDTHLAPIVVAEDPSNIPWLWHRMRREIRNLGGPGVAAMAISAVDNALWDWKARHLGLPLSSLLGAMRPSVPIYASGGFTNFTEDEMRRHLETMGEWGARSLKVKVGRLPMDDESVRLVKVRRVIGDDVALMVDANGAFSRGQAVEAARRFADAGAVWRSEAETSDEPEGLAYVRQHAPAGLEVAAGEYAYVPSDFEHLLDASAVDVLQADATRCLGLSGFLMAASLCEARAMPLSAHCAPAQHLPAALAAPRLRHIEYFFDHARIESMFLDGVPKPRGGELKELSSAPGNGWTVRWADLATYQTYGPTPPQR
ncbi:MAG: mandelate racemase [Elusimicrobia bacterium]|nr:mandelate racemase [Elusimicrobiota bacterium]